MNIPDRDLDAKETAQKLGYSTNHLKLLARNGMIPGTRRGRKWFFNLQELREHFESKTREEIEARTDE